MITALLLLALTQAPEEEGSPVLAPDLPGISVRLKAGEQAPFDGRLVELEENRRRGAAIVDCRAELADAKTNVWAPKPVLVSVIVGAVVLGAAAGAGAVWALKK